MSAKAKKSVPTVDSHPKYSEMILGAIRENKEEGKLNMSRPAILKFVTERYQLDPTMASRHVNLNLKKMLESGAIKPAAAAGRKGAGSYRLGQSLGGKKTTKTGAGDGSERKLTKGKAVSNKEKKVTKGKAGSNKILKVKIQGKKTEKSKKVVGKEKVQKTAIKTATAKPM